MKRYQATYVFEDPIAPFVKVQGRIEMPQWSGTRHETTSEYLLRKVSQLTNPKIIVIPTEGGPIALRAERFISATVEEVE